MKTFPACVLRMQTSSYKQEMKGFALRPRHLRNRSNAEEENKTKVSSPEHKSLNTSLDSECLKNGTFLVLKQVRKC